jgi:hypothetical protein
VGLTAEKEVMAARPTMSEASTGTATRTTPALGTNAMLLRTVNRSGRDNA